MPEWFQRPAGGGVRYVGSRKKGIRRRRRGSGFAYYDGSGKLIPPGEIRARIVQLAIPPAWENVWICPSVQGHLQACGTDARGRRQYLYHPLYRAMRDVAKFERLHDFAMSLPRIRRKVCQDLKLPGLPRNKVLAAVVRLLDSSYIRIGNERYEKQNESFGITTMRSKHLVVNRDGLLLRFRGKGGKEHQIEIKDAKLAKVLKRCDELPGRRLLQYRENGEQGVIHSEDVNAYLAEISGSTFTAKDFRTWGGSVRATQKLVSLGRAESASQRRRNIVSAYRYVAEALGNTPTICRKYYVHPAITLAYEEGQLEHRISLGSKKILPGLRKIERGVAGVIKYSSDEAFRRWIADAA